MSLSQPAKIFIGMVLAGVALGGGSFRGKYMEWTAPDLKGIDAASSEFPKQRDRVLKYFTQSCRLTQNCIDAANSLDSHQAVTSCRLAKVGLLSLDKPADLPPSAFKTLRLLSQSSANFASRMEERWSLHEPRGRKTWNLQNLWSRWEIDTCGPDTIEKRLLRVYNLGEVIEGISVSCVKLEELDRLNGPALHQSADASVIK